MVGKAISVGREVLAGVGFNGKHGSAQQENRVCATITPTTPSGSGLLAASTALCSSMQTSVCVCRHWCTLGIGCVSNCCHQCSSIPVCTGAAMGGSYRNVFIELYKPSFCIAAPCRAPLLCLNRQKQPPCSTISLHSHPQGPKAAPAPCQAALSPHRSVFIVGPVHRRGPRSPHFCIDKCIQYLQMAVAWLLYVKSI